MLGNDSLLDALFHSRLGGSHTTRAKGSPVNSTHHFSQLLEVVNNWVSVKLQRHPGSTQQWLVFVATPVFLSRSRAPAPPPSPTLCSMMHTAVDR